MRGVSESTWAPVRDAGGAVALGSSEPVEGLCATCVHQPDCTYPARFGAPHLGCDEASLPPAPRAERPPVVALAPAHEPTLGLCATCENEPTCTFPRPEGGVWQCEEYA